MKVEVTAKKWKETPINATSGYAVKGSYNTVKIVLEGEEGLVNGILKLLKDSKDLHWE